MKNNLWLIVMAMTAAVLAGVYFYISMDTEPSVTGVLYTFPSAERLVEMHITNMHGSFSLARTNDKWGLVSPGIYRASQQKAAVMESILLELPINRELKGELAEYGFAKPQATIELVSASGIRKAFFVGNLTASKAQVYLKDRDSGKILISDIGTVTQFDGSLDAYREKDIFSVDKAKIVEFSYYKGGEKQVTVSRSSALEWQLTFPYQAQARKIDVNEFLIKLRKWTAVAYPSVKSLDYQLMGLDRPDQALEVMDANGQTQRLEFGKMAEGLMFVRTGSKEDVAGIFAVDVDFSALTAANLLLFEPLHTSIDQVARIDVTSADKTVTFELDNSAQPPHITSGGKEIPYEAFVSFFVKYITLSAVGYESVSQPGQESLALTTTYTDGRIVRVRLLQRDDSSQYLQVDDRTGFYVSDEKIKLLLERLNAALAAG